MNIYEVTVAIDDYRNLSYDRRGMTSEEACRFHDAMGCRGVPKKDWAPPPMRIINPLKPEPDFWDCVARGAFATHPRAKAYVCMFLERAGQLLPVRYKDLELTVLNILEVYNCIDKERSEWARLPTGQPYRLVKPAFVPQQPGSSTLFKIPEQNTTVYCWEQTGKGEDEFKACVEANKLTGLRFKLVWSDEEPRPAQKRKKGSPRH